MLIPRSFAVLALLSTSSMLACGGGTGGEAGSTGGSSDSGGSDTGEELGDPELFPGLRAEVEILIDDRGIPHIYAAARPRPLLRRRLPDGHRPPVPDGPHASAGLRSRRRGARRVEDRRGQDLAPVQLQALGCPRRRALQGRGARRLRPVLAPGSPASTRASTRSTPARQPLPYGFGKSEADYTPERWDNVDTFVIAKMMMFGNSNVLEYEFLASVVKRIAADAFASIQLLRPGMPTFTDAAGGSPRGQRSAPRTRTAPSRWRSSQSCGHRRQGRCRPDPREALAPHASRR
jgi:penicillin amidase